MCYLSKQREGCEDIAGGSCDVPNDLRVGIHLRSCVTHVNRSLFSFRCVVSRPHCFNSNPDCFCETKHLESLCANFDFGLWVTPNTQTGRRLCLVLAAESLAPAWGNICSGGWFTRMEPQTGILLDLFIAVMIGKPGRLHPLYSLNLCVGDEPR